jgi:hypothetical protein
MWRVAREPAIPIDAIGPHRRVLRIDAIARANFRRGLDDEARRAGGDRILNCRQEIGMHDEHARVAIPKDVADLVGFKMPVDRHGIGAEPHRGERRLEESEIVAQEQRDARALADAEGIEAGGGAKHARGQVFARQAPLAADQSFEIRSHRRFRMSRH